MGLRTTTTDYKAVDCEYKDTIDFIGRGIRRIHFTINDQLEYLDIETRVMKGDINNHFNPPNYIQDIALIREIERLLNKITVGEEAAEPNA